MTAAQPFAAAPGSGNGLPYGETGVGAKAPPPPPPTEADGLRARLAEADRTLAGWEQWAERIAASKPAAEPASTPTGWRTLPKRHAVPLCIAAATLATTVGIMRGTPRLNERQVAAMASNQAVATVAPYVDTQLANNRADATTVVKSESFAAYGLELSQDAKTAIGYVGQGANVSLNEKRAEYVAAQVKVLSASVKLLDLRLTSTGPNDLKVHTNVAVGFPLFDPPPTRAPDAAPATTATSAP